MFYILRTWCSKQSFAEISHLVPDKKIFLNVMFLLYYGCDNHLSHVTNIKLTNFHFHCTLKVIHKWLVKNYKVVYEKAMCKWPRTNVKIFQII